MIDNTILEMITSLSDNIGETFTELIKLVLRKTIHPTLNPSCYNSRTIYNPSTGKYERGFVGFDPYDNINKYMYYMVNETLGWNADITAVFRIIPKTMSRQIVARNRNISLDFKRFSEYIITKNSVGGPARSNCADICAMTYADSFSQLNAIGEDIINQTDCLIMPNDSAKMSTAMLRAKLYNLERTLVKFLEQYPDLYLDYVDMVRLLNSEPSGNTPSIISLIGTLALIDWDNVSPLQQQAYINKLGQSFINDFNSNKLIAVLLKSNLPELILTASYLYSLTKMLYSVFGYDKLIPNLFNKEDPFADPRASCKPEYIQKYNEKNRGAFICRSSQNCEEQFVLKVAPNRCDNSYVIDCIPPSECYYEFIKLYCELYPAITSIMGGYHFPEPCQNLLCCDIPANYYKLYSIPDFLLRFAEYSYCVYLECIELKQVTHALGPRIDGKIRYLKSL